MTENVLAAIPTKGLLATGLIINQAGIAGFSKCRVHCSVACSDYGRVDQPVPAADLSLQFKYDPVDGGSYTVVLIDHTDQVMLAIQNDDDAEETTPTIYRSWLWVDLDDPNFANLLKRKIDEALADWEEECSADD